MELDFKLRYSSSERFCKDINGIIKDRFGTLRKIQSELETRQELATVLSNIVDNLHDKHLKLLATKGLCSCQSEEDASNFDKQLDPVEEQIKKSLNKLNALKSIKYAKIDINRLKATWRASQLKNVRQQMMANENTNGEDNNNEVNGPEDNSVLYEETCMNSQFELDLEQKIYEAQVDEVTSLIQTLMYDIRMKRNAIEVAKQKNWVLLTSKRNLEKNNNKLTDFTKKCTCSFEESEENKVKGEEKKKLQEEIKIIDENLKYWEEQYAVIKDGRSLKVPKEEPVNISTNVMDAVIEQESRVHHQQHQPQQTQACMYSNEAQGLPVTTAQGTASPAVIYLEAMMSQIPQQPTYISPVHPTVQFLPGGYQASTYQTAPDGSIHVFGSDGVPASYVAYQ